MFAGFTHAPAIKLAQELVNITPKNLKKVFFSDNGSTAVETALKISFQYWHNKGEKKKRFVSLDYAYHGDTIGAMSISGVDLFSKIFSPLFFKSIKAPSPYCYRCPVKRERNSCSLDCIKPLERVLAKRHKEIAAIIMEPMIMAAGGMIVYPKEYLRSVRRLTKKYNIHLILDEVATGFGRTGKMFACEHANISPDIMCLSKGITAGYLPLGATLTTDNIYKAFYADHKERKTFYHGHTYTANPIACAAALASLEVFKREETLSKVNNIMPILHKGLERFKSLKIVGDIRHIGMIGAIELVKDKKRKAPFTHNDRVGQDIYKAALCENLILRPLGNIIYLWLPLCIKKRELEMILNRTYKILS